jgi:asparagine synthase (glutamine-hydrolysing)
MCGVVGILAPDGGQAPVGLLERMSAAVAHRGPDDQGTWIDPDAGIALGHRRLSIVDLSPAGHQPMVSADGRWVLVFNGEVYDHADHRAALVSSGVRPRGGSDTEVLLELIARHGVVEAIQRIDAMFAFGVWDRQRRELTLARDRLGEKPLYYGRVGGRFAFASELIALRQLPGAPRSVDPAALAEYLRYGFVPAPLSILPGISKLPPGTTVRITADGSPAQPEAYWSLDAVARAGTATACDLSDAELVDRAEQLLLRSVRRRLEADVPVGAFLSGGVDSSTIAALAQASSSTPIRTFTVAVGGASDESAAAAAIARHLGTEHTTLPLGPSAALDLAPRMAAVYDEPFADPSGVPTTLLCAAAREHVTVCLSGDGADELLAGYNRYRVAGGGLARLLRLPAGARRGLGAGVLRVAPERWDRVARRFPGAPPAAGDKAHKLAHTLRASGAMGAYESLSTVWEPTSVMKGAPATPPVVRGEVGALPTALDQMLLADQLRTLPDNMLVKVDRASMSVGLEVRVPFLDHRFAEYTWSLPDRAKVREGQGKWLVRQVLGRHVPAVLWQRPKMGFDPPLAQWLRDPLREWAGDLLSADRLARQGLLDPAPVSRAWADHQSGARNMDYPLWTLLMLQSWLDDAQAEAA